MVIDYDGRILDALKVSVFLLGPGCTLMSIAEGAMAHCDLPMGPRTVYHRDLGVIRHLI